MPDGHGVLKDRSVHHARVKRSKDRKLTATKKTSQDVFEWLEQHEVNTMESGETVNGLDLLARAPAKEHITRGCIRNEQRCDQIWDGTERVGEVVGQADGTTDPEIPIIGVKRSLFDSQHLIEYAILDLAQNDNLALDKCGECDKAQHTRHSCK